MITTRTIETAEAVKTAETLKAAKAGSQKLRSYFERPVSDVTVHRGLNAHVNLIPSRVPPHGHWYQECGKHRGGLDLHVHLGPQARTDTQNEVTKIALII